MDRSRTQPSTAWRRQWLVATFLCPTLSTATDLRDLLAAGEALTIVRHNNPDPDCLASAFALGRLAVDAGIDEHCIVYSGEISHQQNRAFVTLLDIDLHPFDPPSVQDRPEGSLLAFVDHSIPGANNRVPEGTQVDVVVGDIGSAGGHREMAGGEIPLGIFADYTSEDDQLVSIIDRVVSARLFDALNIEAADEPSGDASASE